MNYLVEKSSVMTTRTTTTMIGSNSISQMQFVDSNWSRCDEFHDFVVHLNLRTTKKGPFKWLSKEVHNKEVAGSNPGAVVY